MSESIVSINEEPLRLGIEELVKNTVRDVINQLLEEEADELANAERHGRAAGREACRSGRCERKPVTLAGEAGLDVPRLRGATFQAAAIGRRRRRGASVGEAVVEMRLAGVSARRVEDASRTPWGAGVSAGAVPDLDDKASASAEERGNRPLGGGCPHVLVDGVRLRRGRGGPCERAARMLKAMHARESPRSPWPRPRALPPASGR